MVGKWRWQGKPKMPEKKPANGLLSLSRILHRFCFLHHGYYTDFAFSTTDTTQILLSPPQILHRFCILHHRYYTDFAFSTTDTTQILLSPPRILHRFCFLHHRYYTDFAFFTTETTQILLYPLRILHRFLWDQSGYPSWPATYGPPELCNDLSSFSKRSGLLFFFLA